MDTLANLKRRLAAMKAEGMIGLGQDVTNLSPAARMLLAQLTRPTARVAPPRVTPTPPVAPPPPPDPRLIAIPGGEF